MATAVRPIPEGFHTLTPHLVVSDGQQAIEFYKKAFGAEELFRMPSPDGKSIMHAELKIGDSVLFLCDEFPGANRSPQSLKGTSVALHLYVEDVDAAFKRATEAGAVAQMPPEDMFCGDRYSKVVDPFGHEWSLATHIKEVTIEEMSKAAAAAFAQSGGE